MKRISKVLSLGMIMIFILMIFKPYSVLAEGSLASVPTVEEQKKQIENAKKAQDILYDKLQIGKGDVPEFYWGGATNPEQTGTVGMVSYSWEVFSSARSGYTGVRAGFYDDWFKGLQKGLQEMKDAGITAKDIKMTEWEKLVLAVTAIGYDPRDIKAYDLIEIISNKDNIKTAAQSLAREYAILALSSYNYIDYVPKDENHIDRAYLDELIHMYAEDKIKQKHEDGARNRIDDLLLMAIQPMVVYYDPSAKEGDKYYDVKQAMEKLFDEISEAQTNGGFFLGKYGEGNNPWTNAQVYMTLGMAKANIFDQKYIKSGKTVLDGALELFDVRQGTTKVDKDFYEPMQIGRGLNSLVRAYEGGNSIFDCTDVKDSTVLVNNSIDALPNKIASVNKEQVEKAWVLYNNLSAAKKASIRDSRVAKLDAARKAVDNPDVEDKTLEISNLTEEKEFKLGSDAKISIKAKNNSDKDRQVSLIVELYDENNKFIKYVSGKKTIKNGQSSILNGMVKLPKEGIYKLKAFVWDSLENMNPLSNVIEIPVESNKE